MIQIYLISGMIADFGFYLDIRPVPFRPVSVDTLRRETEKEMLGGETEKEMLGRETEMEMLGRETERRNGDEGRQRLEVVGERNRKKEMFWKWKKEMFWKWKKEMFGR